jgi:hypothetical protein
VILTTGCNHWDSGLDVVVEGDAVQLRDHDMLQRLADAWTTKWDGRWQYTVQNGSVQQGSGKPALVFSVTPNKIRVFAKGSFSQTRHRF